METTVKNVQNGKGEETAACETMELVMESRSENEEFARVVAAVFASRLDPTLEELDDIKTCLLYTSPSPRDGLLSRMPSSA